MITYLKLVKSGNSRLDMVLVKKNAFGDNKALSETWVSKNKGIFLHNKSLIALKRTYSKLHRNKAAIWGNRKVSKLYFYGNLNELVGIGVHSFKTLCPNSIIICYATNYSHLSQGIVNCIDSFNSIDFDK